MVFRLNLHHSALLFAVLMPSATICAQQKLDAQQTLNKPVAQPGAPQPAAPAATAKPKRATAAEKAKIEQQKALGLSLLVSLANDARNFSDQKLRARTLSRVADSLWESDPEQGRALFRKAWDAAEASDQESIRRTEEDRQRQQNGNPDAPVAIVAAPELRAEVLRLAARRDRAIGEEFLNKLEEARKAEASDATTPNHPLDTSAAIKQRLRLANQLVEPDVERAIQFADPALTSVTMDGINFLSFLREKNAAAADQRFVRMLAMADADVKSDANTISLLSSYLFTPHLFVTFEPGGGQSSSSMNQRTPVPEVSPELRNAFFRSAANVLLRPLPAKEQDRSSSGLEGKFFVIKRMLPLFEQYAPREMTEQLRAELSVLGQGNQRSARNDEDDDYPLQRGITPDRKPEDMEKALLDRIDRAKTSEERDGIYLQLATRAAQRGDLRARDFADKIEESELRQQVKPYVDMSIARSAAQKKDIEKALFIAKGELTHLQRVWLLTQIAQSLPPAEHDRAVDLISDAAAEARRIDVSDPDRPRALVAVANALLAVDRPRAWETMLEVAKASNSAEGFSGEDGRLVLKLLSKNMSSVHSSGVDEFNLPGVFRALSQENATQAIEIARSFEGEAPRATALIAVAKQLLSAR
jgi:hypothetical protein